MQGNPENQEHQQDKRSGAKQKQDQERGHWNSIKHQAILRVAIGFEKSENPEASHAKKNAPKPCGRGAFENNGG